MLEGHKAAWNIYKLNGDFLITLNCLYDSNDFLSEVAASWEIDYKNKTIRITKEFDE
jgi:hypothetical protein